jgi:hypothetical protein
MRRAVTYGIALSCALAGSLHAQATPADSARAAARCRLAAQVLTTGHPAPHLGWATTVIGSCEPSLAASAIAHGIGRNRQLRDTAALRRIWRPTNDFRDARLLTAILNIAGDREASVPARVFAFRALVLLGHPERRVEYRHLVGGVDSTLPIPRPRGGCGFASFSSHVALTTGEPLPSDFRSQIRVLRDRVYRDSSEPTDVRTAALCA